MRPILAAALAAAIALSAPPAASAMTGNQLLDACTKGQAPSNEAVLAHVACGAYIAGVVDLDPVINPYMRVQGLPGFCLPQDVTNNQLTNLVIQRLRNAPADNHMPGGILVVQAMVDAFPCK